MKKPVIPQVYNAFLAAEVAVAVTAVLEVVPMPMIVRPVKAVLWECADFAWRTRTAEVMKLAIREALVANKAISK